MKKLRKLELGDYLQYHLLWPVFHGRGVKLVEFVYPWPPQHTKILYF